MSQYQDQKLDDLLNAVHEVGKQVSNLDTQLSGRGGVYDRLDAHSEKFRLLEDRYNLEIKRVEAQQSLDRANVEKQKQLIARGLSFIAGLSFIGSVLGGAFKTVIFKFLGWN